jgi:transposase
VASEAELELFGLALGLVEPWRVVRTEFDQDAGQLDLYLDFARGARFPCPESGCKERSCAVHDTEDKTWRHLDFFQHKAFLHARTPRVRCDEHGVRLVAVPWARAGSGFTLLFEALLITFAKAMPVKQIAKHVREQDTRIWRVLEGFVSRERAKCDYSPVRRVGMDETSAAKGQDYVSIFMDLDADKRVLFATPGRDGGTVEAFADDLRAHGGDPAAITDTSSDMSASFIAGIRDNLPNATMTFDRYHIMAHLSTAVDEVRRGEARTAPELHKTRWVWLKNRTNLDASQLRLLNWLTRPSSQLKTARAYKWREDFQAFYQQDPADAEDYLTRWCAGAMRSRLEPLKTFVTLVRTHWTGILAWHRSHVTNGLLEGTNSLVQAAKARARGYRNKDYMITIVYLIGAKLPMPSLRVTHAI